MAVTKFFLLRNPRAMHLPTGFGVDGFTGGVGDKKPQIGDDVGEN
jgi:hypothetical protein